MTTATTEPTTDLLDGYDAPIFDEEAARFPIVGWRNGQAKGESGFFYIRADDLADSPDPSVWTLSDRYSSGSKVEQGYEATQIDIAVLATREQWYIKNAGGPPTWLDMYETGATK